MTHYNVDFSHLQGDAKRKAAIKEIKTYLGVKKYNGISQVFREANEKQKITSYHQLRFPLAMVGVQGYPVLAWYETLFGERTPEQIVKDEEINNSLLD